MNKESSKMFNPLKNIKPVAPIKKMQKDQAYSLKNSIRKPNAIKNNEMVLSIMSTTGRIDKEKRDKELKNKQDEISHLKQKRTADKLQKIIKHKDQIIANKNMKIKQLECEINFVKSQLEKYRIQIRQISASFETNTQSKTEMASKLSKILLYLK